MLFFLLFQDNPILIVPWIFALLIAITIHEFSHGYVAYVLGDDTAERSGRLTLNPIKHLDLFGSIFLILVGFGWAKPVPIDPLKIRGGNRGQFAVSVAGVLANITMAVFAILAVKILLGIGFLEVNLLIKFLAFLIYINLALFVFNLIPIAPLDGYRMFEAVAPKAFMRFAPFMEQWGFIILIAIVFLTNIVSILIGSFIYIFSLLFNLPIYSLVF